MRFANDVTPEVGQVWTFTNKDGMISDWRIESQMPDTVTLLKLTGPQAGTFRRSYKLEFLWQPEWVLKTEANDFLWECPSCGEGKGILIGDYICVDCRSLLTAA